MSAPVGGKSQTTPDLDKQSSPSLVAFLEEGGHRDLPLRGGLYAELWARQSGGFMAK
jgi:ATP-binding cassette subfamily B multidrug efflux pump